MKKLILIIIILFGSITVNAQSDTTSLLLKRVENLESYTHRLDLNLETFKERRNGALVLTGLGIMMESIYLSQLSDNNNSNNDIQWVRYSGAGFLVIGGILWIDSFKWVSYRKKPKPLN